MYRVILSFCLLVHSTRADSTEPPDPQNNEFGPNTFCLFAYDSWIFPENLNMPTNGKLYGDTGQATLKDYRLDFGAGSMGAFFTVASHNGENVLGSTYEFPKSSCQSLLGQIKNAADGHFIEVSVTVNKDGKSQTATCFTIAAKNKPPLGREIPLPAERKPAQEVVATLVSTFSKAHFPEKYIEEFQFFATAYIKDPEQLPEGDPKKPK